MTDVDDALELVETPSQTSGTRYDPEAEHRGELARTVAGVSDVLGDAPAAVLLVDLADHRIVFANQTASQLAPQLALPASLDAWSDAAGVRDLDGGLLTETDHPLTRVARGEPVSGQAVSAARDSDLGAQRAPLWVIALPLDGAPGLDDHTLVVMLPLRLREVAMAARDQGQAHTDLRSRAVLATGLSFTMADATDDEMPLIWVNPAFTATTGYSFEESVGHNCRFLQGPGTDPEEVRRIGRHLRAGQGITTTLLNYRKDGTAYWNQVTISPVHGEDGTPTHFVGIQSDVSGRIEADRARDEALAAERRARADAEAAEARLRLLADASVRLVAELDVAEVRRRLLGLVVPEVADLVVLYHVDEGGRVSEVVSEHRDPEQREALAEMARALPPALRAGPVVDVLVGDSGARLLRDLDTPEGDEVRRSYIADDDYFRLTSSLEIPSAVFVPLPGRGGTDDVMVMARESAREQFDQADLDTALDLGRRAGLILETARLYQTQQHIAETLQRSLLPDLPAIPGIRSAARYHTGSAGAEVGGDFYELTALRDGTVALAVGDVVGHDMLAAAAMGHLKGAMRACAREEGTTPAKVLQRVDDLLQGVRMQTLATSLQAFLRPLTDGTDGLPGGEWEVRWSSAGHLPLVVRRPDGSASLLSPLDGGETGNDPMLGLDPGRRQDHVTRVPAGSTLVGYTDGLIERRGESLELGLHRLLHQVTVAPGDVLHLVDHLVDTLARDHDDDVAVVGVTLG